MLDLAEEYYILATQLTWSRGNDNVIMNSRGVDDVTLTSCVVDYLIMTSSDVDDVTLQY